MSNITKEEINNMKERHKLPSNSVHDTLLNVQGEKNLMSILPKKRFII